MAPAPGRSARTITPWPPLPGLSPAPPWHAVRSGQPPPPHPAAAEEPVALGGGGGGPYALPGRRLFPGPDPDPSLAEVLKLKCSLRRMVQGHNVQVGCGGGAVPLLSYAVAVLCLGGVCGGRRKARRYTSAGYKVCGTTLEVSTSSSASQIVVRPLSAPPRPACSPQAVQLLLSLLAALPVTAQLLADSQVAGLVAPLQHHSSAAVAAAARCGWGRGCGCLWVWQGGKAQVHHKGPAGAGVAEGVRPGQALAGVGRMWELESVLTLS